MKKTLTLIMLAVTSMTFAQKPFKMEGNIEGEKTVSKLYIKFADADKYNQFSSEDSIDVKNGKFSYKKDLTEIAPAFIYSDKTDEKNGSAVFFVPGETLKLTINGSEFTYDGSDIYKSCDAADKALTPLNKDLMDYYNAAVVRLQTVPDSLREAVTAGIRDTLNTKSEAYNTALQSYLDNHTNVAGALLFLLYQVNPDEVLQKMSADMKSGLVGKLYQARSKAIAAEREKQKEAEAKEQAELDARNGTPAPDFTLSDIKGKPLSLSSLQGKYVVLDFWGSWCIWCIRGIPEMKKYYEKYAGKFEILGIDCNDTDAAWRAAVEKNELPWLHVYNPKDSNVLKDYSVRGFPTKVIVDPKGNIVKTVVGEDPAFYEFLDKLFQ